MRLAVRYRVGMLNEIESYSGVQKDKLRYLFLLLVSYPLALIFRHVLHYAKVSPTIRHVYLGIFGVLFSIICFGSQTVFLLGFTLISYAFLFFLPPQKVHWYTMFIAIVLMSVAHIYRMITDYAGWSLDFTSPLMVMVQKTTYVAFAFHDGKTKRKDLNKDQDVNKIEDIPSVVEYMCYCFNFLSFLMGPSSTYVEYIEMVTGRNFKKFSSNEPSVFSAALSKFAVAIVVLFVWFYFESSHNLKGSVLDDSIPFYIKIFIISLFGFTKRCVFYFGFCISDSICNVAGYGFNGYDDLGQTKWDLVTAVYVTKLEFGTNFKELTNSWNICTARWLRRCIYERVPSFLSPTIMTFLVSAIWHGFYPVYYHAFIYVGIATLAARKIRVHVRPLFQHSTTTKTLYDLITILTTSVYKDYALIVLTLLSTHESSKFAGYYYYFPLISVIVVSLFMPLNRQKSKSHTSTKQEKSNVLM